MRVLGIIPARGGSKGVPRKNLRPVAGVPLVVHAVRSAAGARRLDRWVVSTDDADIAAVARAHGAEVLERPAKLAEDDTPMAAVALHALDEARARWGPMDAVAVLQPTSPQRTPADIDAALELLASSGASSVVSVYHVEDLHPARMYRLGEGGLLLPLDARYEGLPRQALPPVYHRNGVVYACRADHLRRTGGLIGPDARAYVMPRERSLNIDDEFDLRLADLLMQDARAP